MLRQCQRLAPYVSAIGVILTFLQFFCFHMLCLGYANLGNPAFLNTLPSKERLIQFLATVVSPSQSQQWWFLQTMQGGRMKPIPGFQNIFIFLGNYDWVHSNMQRSLLKEEHPGFLLQQNVNRFYLYFVLEKKDKQKFSSWASDKWAVKCWLGWDKAD